MGTYFVSHYTIEFVDFFTNKLEKRKVCFNGKQLSWRVCVCRLCVEHKVCMAKGNDILLKKTKKPLFSHFFH